MLYEADRIDSNLFVVRGARCDHLRKVLKVQPGDELAIGLLNTRLGQGRVEAVSPDEVRLEAAFFEEVPKPPETSLILAMPRPKVLRRILPELVALGLRKIVVLRSWRVEKSYLASDVVEAQVYRPLMHLGLAQGKYVHEPEFSFEPQFRPFVEDRLEGWVEQSTRLIAHPNAESSMADVSLATNSKVALAVGPEGGWIDYELETFENNGFRRIQLGERVLKVETACAVLMGQLELLRTQAKAAS